MFALGLAVTSGVARCCCTRSRPTPGAPLELAVLIAANVVATLLRFVLFRAWVFPRQRLGPTTARLVP